MWHEDIPIQNEARADPMPQMQKMGSFHESLFRNLISSIRLIEKQVDVIALQELTISDFVVIIVSKD